MHPTAAGHSVAGAGWVAFTFAAVVACSPIQQSAPSTPDIRTSSEEITVRTTHPYVGMWVTADGHIRQELLANGRYDEARGSRSSAYTGSYEVSGNQIDYVDDTGFTADGTFHGDVLHHGGYVFYREGSRAHTEILTSR